MELLEQQKAELEHRRRTIIAPDGQWSCSQHLAVGVGKCNMIVNSLEELKSFCQNW